MRQQADGPIFFTCNRIWFFLQWDHNRLQEISWPISRSIYILAQLYQLIYCLLPRHLNTSGGMLSIPSVLLFFISLMAAITTSLIISSPSSSVSLLTLLLFLWSVFALI